MSLTEVLENDSICKMEEKFSLIKVADDVYEGKYPLQPYLEDARGVFGGELVSQTALAAWELVPSEFSLHSLHSYFLNAGSAESVMRYEVTTNNRTNNYINKTVKVIQKHNELVVFTMTCSFTKNNSIRQRKEDYAAGKTSRPPFEFITTPNPTFRQFVNKLDQEEGLLVFEHTHGLICHAMPQYFLKPIKKHENNNIGDRRLGIFCKIVDNLPTDALKVEKIKIADLLYLSDSFYLGIITRAFGLPVTNTSFQFFRVSLDHSVFIHDTEFDPTQWMFVDFRFSRMSNGRVLCIVAFYDQNGKQIASVNQEGLITLEKSVLDKATGGTYKL